jgi:hypothetical protein
MNMYMTIEAFEHLSEEDKLKTLMNRGRVISENKDEESRVFLYYLGSFYAAVKYNLKTDDLISIDSFERIGRKERIEWKVLRVLPGLQQAMRGKSEGLM